MSAVRNIANHNRTVICTIHSPSEAVYVRARYVYAHMHICHASLTLHQTPPPHHP